MSHLLIDESRAETDPNSQQPKSFTQLIEILTHELINRLGAVAMHFELLPLNSVDILGQRSAVLRVQQSVDETVSLLRLVNSWALCMDSRVARTDSREQVALDLISAHVARYGLPDAVCRALESDKKCIRVRCNEAGIFDEDQSGLAITLLRLLARRNGVSVKDDAREIEVFLS